MLLPPLFYSAGWHCRELRARPRRRGAGVWCNRYRDRGWELGYTQGAIGTI